MPNWQGRLTELGIELPPVAAPVAAYVPAVRTGNLVFTAGQLPFVAGRLPATGAVGAEVSTADAARHARTCALNAMAAVHALVKEELGADPAELFARFEEEPFASASIAQVHFATLHSGEDVVVKIQRPGIRRRVAADLQILKRFAQVVEMGKTGRRLSAQDVVADFADNLAEELDFRIEAQVVSAHTIGGVGLAPRCVFSPLHLFTA